MYKCKFCGKEYLKPQSLAAHVSHCKLNPNKRTKKSYNYKIGLNKVLENLQEEKQNNPYKYEIKEFTVNCKKCGKEYLIHTTEEKFDKGLYTKHCSRSCANSHIHSNDTKKKISNSLKNSDIIKEKVENNNLIKIENNKHKICKYCGKEFSIFSYREVKEHVYCSAECKHNYLSERTGGYRKGSGRGKGGWYKGFYCDSTWELAFLIYHLDNNLYIERCKESRSYYYNEEKHQYYPDFITDDGIIEIKGYTSEQWKAKHEQNPDIKVLYKNDIQMYINYVKEHYTDDLSSLYDNIK